MVFWLIKTKGYGLSESAGGVVHQIDEDEQAFGCVGKLFAGLYGAPSSLPRISHCY